jgi:hypothetical protein
VVNTISAIKPVSFHDPELLSAIEGRLNQNYLVGAAVEHTGVTAVYADGGTLWLAVLALVPRALWPEKPVTAGSMGLVAEYTGLRFARGTSVGLGTILELYINFRRTGVLLGCLLLGIVAGVVDRRARLRLDAGDTTGFAQWFLPALPVLNVGGSFVEMTAASAAAWFLIWGINRSVLAPPVRDPTRRSVARERWRPRGSPS